MLGGRTHAWRAAGAGGSPMYVHACAQPRRANRAFCRGPRAGTVPAASPSIPARTPITRPLYRRPRLASALRCAPLYCITLHPAASRCITLHHAAFRCHLPATCQRPATLHSSRSAPAASRRHRPHRPIIFTHRHPDRRRCRPGCHGTLWRARVLWRVRDRVDRRATGDVDVDVDVTREASVPGGADGRTRRGAVAVFVFVFARTEGARVRRGEGAESRGGQIEPGGASAGPRALDTAYTHTYLFRPVWRRRRVMERWSVSSKRRSVEA